MNTIKRGIEFIKAEDYEELSRFSAKVMLECVRKKPDALICLATGSSPERAYEIFVEIVNKEQVNVEKLRILKLDEWYKVDGNDPSTCEYFIQEKIIKPLNVAPQNYIAFDSNSADAYSECKRISKIIQEQGPIDLCILGIGKNGHLGLNEPGEYFMPFPHVVELDKKTKTHTMLTKTKADINHGITIGMADIMASREILFIASGDEKKDAFDVFMEGKVRTDLPATVLWLHPNTVCVFESKLV